MNSRHPGLATALSQVFNSMAKLVEFLTSLFMRSWTAWTQALLSCFMFLDFRRQPVVLVRCACRQFPYVVGITRTQKALIVWVYRTLRGSDLEHGSLKNHLPIGTLLRFRSRSPPLLAHREANRHRGPTHETHAIDSSRPHDKGHGSHASAGS